MGLATTIEYSRITKFDVSYIKNIWTSITKLSITVELLFSLRDISRFKRRHSLYAVIFPRYSVGEEVMLES